MTETFDFLFVSTDETLTTRLQEVCARVSRSCVCAVSFEGAFDQTNKSRFGCILVDAKDAPQGGLRFLEWLRTRWVPSLIGLFATHSDAFKDIPFARLQLAENFVIADDDVWLEQKITALARANDITQRLSWRAWSDHHGTRLTWVELCPEAAHAVNVAEALHDMPFLFFVTGEQGAGKNILAQALLASDQSLVVWPQAQAPSDQTESFLAQLATLFLKQKETGILPHAALLIEDSAVLTPALQDFLESYFSTGRCMISEQVFEPVLHVVVLSCASPEQLNGTHSMRGDLLARCWHAHILVKPLRERRQDIVRLVDYFIHEWEKQNSVRYLSLDVLEALTSYDWPGNVSELKTTLFAILNATSEATVTAKFLPAEILQKTFYRSEKESEDFSELSYTEAKKRMLHKFHRTYIADVLKKAHNNLTVAAERAQLDRSNFKKIIKKYNLM